MQDENGGSKNGSNWKYRKKRREYNKMVVGIQNYYRIATNISLDASELKRAVMTVITNWLDGISRKGRKLKPAKRMRYGKLAMLRFIADEPIYPISYVQHKKTRCTYLSRRR
ncbi:MAG: hypothetical protein IJP68_09345 [Selenomonadaceae bacterium]|nr:hypothetical protein [Selenomonadaceae bacterium]